MRNDRSALHQRPPRQPERSCVPPRRAWGMGRGLCRCVEMPFYPCVVKSLYRCRCQSAYRRGCASPGGVQPGAERRRGVDERSRGKTTPDRREKALTSAGSLCLWGVATKASPIFLGVDVERRLQAAGRLSAPVCALMSARGIGISTCRCIERLSCIVYSLSRPRPYSDIRCAIND